MITTTAPSMATATAAVSSPSPLIITCPIVGAELTREQYPHLPLSPEELAQSAFEAVQAGASIIHLHVRDKNGNPTQDPAVFEDVTHKIKARCDCIVQYSTGGAVGTSLEERCAPLQLRPEMASLSLGTMNFGESIFENSYGTIRAISEQIQTLNVLAELEIFDLGMLENIPRFLKNKMIPHRFTVDFVLGVSGGMRGDVRNLVLLVQRWNELVTDHSLLLSTWSVAGVGSAQLPLALHAIAMGGNVRVGLEDNVYFSKGRFAKSNAELVQRVAEISKSYGRPVASVSQTRELLGVQ